MADKAPKEEYIVRLSPDVYKQLERDLPVPLVSQTTTELQAGFNLGIQYVLKKLRDGYTIQR